MLNFDISVPTLRNLHLQLKNVGNSYKKKHDVIINTPNLESLSIEDDSFAQYLVKNLARVSNVDVNYDASILFRNVAPKHMNRLLELLKGVSATQLLTLHWSTVDVLGSALPLSYTWPTYPYLTTLIMHLDSFSGWACFLKLLNSAPRLELLFLDLEGLNDVSSDDDDSDDLDDELYEWTPPDSVSACLLGHLELIGIQHFKGNKDELKVVEYILNNTRALQCIMIGYDPDYRNEEVVKLMTFSRASKTCDIQIYQRVVYKIDSPNDVSIGGV